MISIWYFVLIGRTYESGVQIMKIRVVLSPWESLCFLFQHHWFCRVGGPGIQRRHVLSKVHRKDPIDL